MVFDYIFISDYKIVDNKDYVLCFQITGKLLIQQIHFIKGNLHLRKDRLHFIIYIFIHFTVSRYLDKHPITRESYMHKMSYTYDI